MARSSTMPLFVALVLLAACAEQEQEPELEITPDTEHEHEDEHECSAAQQMRIQTILAKTPNQSAGAELFAQTCGTALCHGADGISGPGPSLAEEVPEHSPDQLACVLLIGPGEMTSLESLADQQLADVIAYTLATF